MVQAVSYSVGTQIFGDLCDPSHTECTQHSIVEVRRSTNVSNSDSGVIDHRCLSTVAVVPSAAWRSSGSDTQCLPCLAQAGSPLRFLGDCLRLAFAFSRDRHQHLALARGRLFRLAAPGRLRATT